MSKIKEMSDDSNKIMDQCSSSEELDKKDVVELDDERKAAMVSNLMVVLCADKDVSPVVNSGTLNH